LGITSVPTQLPRAFAKSESLASVQARQLT
jgi:hypothetical protein